MEYIISNKVSSFISLLAAPSNPVLVLSAPSGNFHSANLASPSTEVPTQGTIQASADAITMTVTTPAGDPSEDSCNTVR